MMNSKSEIAAAWLFGYIPAEIREDIETKHPDLHLVGFKRGSSVNLPDQDPRDRFVAIPELWGWGVLRDGPPKRRRRVFALRPATAALLLALLAAPAAAQSALEAAETFSVATPGMSTWWCSDRICSGTGTSRISRAVPQSPPDPWAGGGRFTPTSPASLAAWRARYSYPFVVPGSYVGAWCGQHSVCDAILAEWLSRFGSRTWTAGGACLEAGDLGRAACDAIHTGGATLGCTMLPCGVVSCPSSTRTCSIGGTCGSGWRCTPLLELPEGERIGAVTPQGRTVRARRDTTSGSSDACSFFAVAQGVLWVRQFSPCFAGMPADCQTAASLRPECWAPPQPPVCGDGTCDLGEVCPEDCEPDPPECPPPDPCPDPVPVRALIEVDGCGPLGGRVVTDAGSIPFRPGIRSTGELVMELRERPPCPPLPVCPDPDPCDDPDDPEPPPPTGWELLHQAPAGWTWTADSVPPAQILDIRVPSRGAYSAVRLTYQVAVDWSRCRELPGPSPSAKCLGVYLTREGRADQVLSYLMAVAEYRASGGRLTLEPSKLTHRHGWVPGWSPTQKPRAGAPVRLLDGETYTIEHEVVDGKVTVSVTGQAVAAVLRAPDTCTPAPCFPALFPAGALVLRAGWRGDEPDEVGGTMGWVLSGLRLEVRR